MSWFELRSPQKITLYPCVRTTAATPSASISVNPDIASAISRVSEGYSRITTRVQGSARSSNYDGVIMGAPDRADSAITSYLQCQGVTGTTFDTEIKDASGVADGTAHVIAAILRDSAGPASDFQYNVECPLVSPKILIARFNGTSGVFSTGGKYMTAERTSGGDAAGDWTITFRRLTIGAPPVIAVCSNNSNAGSRVQVQSVTTSSFRLRTSTSGVAANVSVALAICFSTQATGRGSVTAPILTSRRNCGLYIAYVSNNGTASIAAPYDELFTVTRAGAGEVSVVFKERHRKPDQINYFPYAAFAAPVVDGNVFATTAAENQINVWGRDEATGTLTDTDFILAVFSWLDETEY